VSKARALREHLRTVTLFVRDHDLLAGSIAERPGAMPLNVELGIAECSIYVGENPERRGYLKGAVPPEIHEYWLDRNMWGRARALRRDETGVEQPWTPVAGYKQTTNQGHLSPSYRELLAVGIGGILDRIRDRMSAAADPESLAFLAAAEDAMCGLSEWAERYGGCLREAAGRASGARARELARMGDNCAKVATLPPNTFHEAMQLVWLAQQAIHIEGHGYSCTPDRIDQILYPYYLADRKAGRLDDEEALALCANFILKQRDNTVWGVEHNLTQGLCLGGSTPAGEDLTNELSWMFITASGAMSVPEPLVWIRWHERMDPAFFDHCLKNLAGTTCFPLMMSDVAVPKMFMELGVSEEDAFEYVPVGCNEIGIPGKAYFNPNAGVGYLTALELAITGGRTYAGTRTPGDDEPVVGPDASFDDVVRIASYHMRRQVEGSYASGMKTLSMQMRWGHTPLTSCFFDGCIDRARDMVAATKYNILSCSGSSFANMVDCLAALREVVYEKRSATLGRVVEACRANFVGHEALRQELLDAPKHGNDEPVLRKLVTLVERMRDEPMKEICRDPRDGTRFGNTHVVRSGAVRRGKSVPATPDGRLAGQPLASSVASSYATERKGPTAVVNSILMLDPVKSWQSGYNVNMRFSQAALTDDENRGKVASLLNSYFRRGGQEMQINCVSSETLRAAQRNPDEYRDIVVRVAGFSAFFVDLQEDIQEEVISRTEHGM